MEIIYLSAEAVAVAHAYIVEQTGEPTGVSSYHLLESAIAAAEQGESYEGWDIIEMAAAYAYHLSRNHPFIEGNKRTAVAACDTFLTLNGYSFLPDQDAFANIIEAVVVGKRTKSELAEFIRSSCEPTAQQVGRAGLLAGSRRHRWWLLVIAILLAGYCAVAYGHAWFGGLRGMELMEHATLFVAGPLVLCLLTLFTYLKK